MIITKTEPFTKDDIEKLREQFTTYIKTVVDIEQKMCSAGCDRHFESEKILLDQGSNQQNLWGGGIEIETKIIDCNSFINIRATQGNASNEILDRRTRKKFEMVMEYFFKSLYEQ